MFDSVDEFGDAVDCAFAEAWDFGSALECVEESEVVVDSEEFDTADGLCADTTGWVIDNALQVYFIVGVDDESEVGEGIFDFLALEEGGSAYDGVGECGFAELCFEDTGECVSAVEDGHIAPGNFVIGVNFLEELRDGLGFFVFTFECGYGWFDASLACCVEWFILSFFVIFYEFICGFEDWRGGAEIFAEFDGLGIGEVVLKFEDVFDVSASPCVDGLVGIAYDADVAVGGSCEHACYDELCVVGVLIFIYQYVTEAALEGSADFFIITKECGYIEEEIVEIDCVIFEEDFLV